MKQQHADVPTFDAEVNNALKGGKFLPDAVTQSDLTKMDAKQLDGRLEYYEQQYTFERSKKLAAEYSQEVERTRIEINRRKLYARKEAERVFEL